MSSVVAEAGEVNLGGESRVGYDSNVFNDTRDEIDSAVAMLRVRGEVNDQLERGDYGLYYSPTYFINSASEADNTWNHHLGLHGNYHLSPRTSVSMSEEFQFLEKLVFQGDTPSGTTNPATDPDLDDTSRETIRNRLSVGGRHLLDQRWSVFGGSDYTITRFSRAKDEDNDLVAGNFGTSYSLHQRVQIGGGVNVSYRTFEGRDAPFIIITNPGPPPQRIAVPLCFGQKSPRSNSLSYSAYFSGSFQIDATTYLQAQAGPARIESSRYLCDGGPGRPDLYVKDESDQTTWFASGELGKRWKRVDASARYNRSEGSGGAGQTTVNDTLVARLRFTPARFWKIDARGSWIQRDSTQSQLDNSSQSSKTTTWTGSLSVSRQLLRRMRGSVDVGYRNQNAKGSTGDFDTWRISFGLKYDLDTIRY